jgi:hypothetical protein
MVTDLVKQGELKRLCRVQSGLATGDRRGGRLFTPLSFMRLD